MNDEPQFVPVGAYSLGFDENGKLLIVPTFQAARTVTVPEPEEYINPEFIVTKTGVKVLVDDRGKPTYSTDTYNIVQEEKHKPLNLYARYLPAPKDYEVEHLKQRYNADKSAIDLSKLFSALMTGGYSLVAENAGKEWNKGNKWHAALDFATPAMFGTNLPNLIAQGLYGGTHLLDENGIRKTYNLIKDRQYGNAALSGLGDIFNAALTKFGGNAVGEELLTQLAKRGNNTARAIQLSREISNARLKEQETVFPGLIGWAPKQTVKGYHASNESEFIPNFYFKGWAQKTHNAPLGIYLAKGTKPESGFLTKRPYVYNLTTEFDKPQIQIGEVKGSTKNGIRNLIEQNAIDQGADGIIYSGIADNQMQNQTIYKTLHPDVQVKPIVNIKDTRYFYNQPYPILRGHANIPLETHDPLLTRLSRLKHRQELKEINSKEYNTIYEGTEGFNLPPQSLTIKPVIRYNDIRKAMLDIDPSFTDKEIDEAVQIIFSDKQGVHFDVGRENTIGGVSLVDIHDAMNLVRKLNGRNAVPYDIKMIGGHEIGHGVNLPKEAINLVKDYYAPEEFYTQAGQILDDAGLVHTTINPISYNKFMNLLDNYLDKGNINNGISNLKDFMLSLKPIDRQKVMKNINRFSVGILGMYGLKQLNNNNGKVQ